MANITTLFLDVGGVLLTNGWDRGCRQRAAEKFGLDAKEVDERHRMTFDTYELGKLRLEDYLDRTVFYQPRGFTRDDFIAFMLEQSQLLPDMIDFVTALKQRHGLRVAVVSNEGRVLTEHRVQTFGLGRFVDFFIFSCFVHFRKPDPDIFRLALDVAQVRPEQVAYLDDRKMFTEIAAGMGIHGIHHTGFSTSRDQLAKLGLTL